MFHSCKFDCVVYYLIMCYFHLFYQGHYKQFKSKVQASGTPILKAKLYTSVIIYLPWFDIRKVRVQEIPRGKVHVYTYTLAQSVQICHIASPGKQLARELTEQFVGSSQEKCIIVFRLETLLAQVVLKLFSQV